MRFSNNSNQLLRWSTFAALLCVCVCFVGLMPAPTTDRMTDTEDNMSAGTEFETRVSLEDLGLAVSTYSRDREKLELVGTLEEKIASHFPIPQTEANEFATWIVRSADKHGIDEILLTSIVATESSFRKDAVSHKGAIGPAQIMPKYWEEFCAPLDLNVPSDNIECGARILSHLMEQCWDESCAMSSKSTISIC